MLRSLNFFEVEHLYVSEKVFFCRPNRQYNKENIVLSDDLHPAVTNVFVFLHTIFTRRRLAKLNFQLNHAEYRFPSSSFISTLLKKTDGK